MARRKPSPLPPAGDPVKPEDPAAPASFAGLTVSRKLERRAQFLAVEGMLRQGYGEGAVAAYGRANWGWSDGRRRARLLIDRVHARWAAEAEAERPRERVAQVQRLKNMVARLKAGEPKEWNVAGIIAAERLLADVLGTREPIKVELSSSRLQAIDRVVSDLPPGRFEAAVAAYMRNVELAEKAKVLLRLGDGTEVVARRP